MLLGQRVPLGQHSLRHGAGVLQPVPCITRQRLVHCRYRDNQPDAEQNKSSPLPPLSADAAKVFSEPPIAPRQQPSPAPAQNNQRTDAPSAAPKVQSPGTNGSHRSTQDNNKHTAASTQPAAAPTQPAAAPTQPAAAPTQPAAASTQPTAARQAPPTSGKNDAATSGGPSTSKPIDVQLPDAAPPARGVPVSTTTTALYAAVGAGFALLATALIFAPTLTVKALMPSVGEVQGRGALAALWGASLLPVAAAALTMQDAARAGMIGTHFPNQVNSALMLSCGFSLVVVAQALSLRHPMLAGVFGGLCGLGLLVGSWSTSRKHPWSLPLPSIKGVIHTVLSVLTPATGLAAVYSGLSIMLLGAGTYMMRAGPGVASPLLGTPPPLPALSVFVSRVAGASIIAAGVLVLAVKEAADRALLAAPTVVRLNSSLALGSTVAAGLLVLSLAIKGAVASRQVVLLLTMHLVVAAVTGFAAYRPQSATAADPGLPNLPAALRPNAGAAQTGAGSNMTPLRFFQAAAVPKDSHF